MLSVILLAATVVSHRFPAITDGACDGDELRVRHEVTVPRFRLKSSAASTAINDFVEEHAKDTVDYDAEAKQEKCEDYNSRIAIQAIKCEAGLVTDEFAGVHCHAEADIGAHPADWPESYNFRILGNTIRELSLDDFFIGDYEAALREELTHAVRSSEHRNPDARHSDGDIIGRLEKATLGKKSMIFAYDLSARTYNTVEIPYSRLRRILRPSLWRAVRQR